MSLENSGAMSSLNLLLESIPIKYGRFNLGIKSPSSVASIKIFDLYVTEFSLVFSVNFLSLTTLSIVVPYRIVKFFSDPAISLSILFPIEGSNIRLLTHPVLRLSKCP